MKKWTLNRGKTQHKRMFFSRKILLRIIQLPQIVDFSFQSSYLSVLQRFRYGNYCCKKHISSSLVILKDEIPSTLSKYELFSEKTAPVILDVEEERQKIESNEKVFYEFEGINLKRSVDGVFDVNEMVELLEKEKGEDIFVVRIPPEYGYSDYMVIVTGRSTKHMIAMSNYIRKVYKLKVNSKGHIPKVEGKNSNVWMAMDLGNIILHVFSKAGREIYDLETLWSVGKDFDTVLQQKNTSDSLLTDYSKMLAKLSPNT